MQPEERGHGRSGESKGLSVKAGKDCLSSRDPYHLPFSGRSGQARASGQLVVVEYGSEQFVFIILTWKYYSNIKQWFSSGHGFCLVGDFWQYLEGFLVITTRGSHYWHLVGRGQGHF